MIPVTLKIAAGVIVTVFVGIVGERRGRRRERDRRHWVPRRHVVRQPGVDAPEDAPCVVNPFLARVRREDRVEPEPNEAGTEPGLGAGRERGVDRRALEDWDGVSNVPNWGEAAARCEQLTGRC